MTALLELRRRIELRSLPKATLKVHSGKLGIEHRTICWNYRATVRSAKNSSTKTTLRDSEIMG